MYCLVQNGDGAKAIIRYQALKEAAKTDNDLCAEFPSALALYATAMAMQSKLGVSIIESVATGFMFISTFQYNTSIYMDPFHLQFLGGRVCSGIPCGL